jgi:hypothetical protein
MGSVLIVGGQFGNQGAQLMLKAAADAVRSRFDAAPVVDFPLGSATQRAKVGVGTIWTPRILPAGRGPQVPARVRRFSPFVAGREVEAVFDISGFRYADDWAHLPLSKYAAYLADWKRAGAKVYLLPQAFGPFAQVATATRKALASADLVFARDPKSMEYLEELNGEHLAGRVHLRSDFTILVKGVIPPRLNEFAGRVPVVVNSNISDRRPGSGGRTQYLSVLAQTVRELRTRGLAPYGLLHGGAKDRELLQSLADEVGDMPILAGLDGVAQKGLLGTAPVVVSGRFHAIASALGQGVPTVIHGWSHKYEWLAKDFDALELVADPFGAQSTSDAVTASLEEPSIRGAIESTLPARREDAEAMWSTVAATHLA